MFLRKILCDPESGAPAAPATPPADPPAPAPNPSPLGQDPNPPAPATPPSDPPADPPATPPATPPSGKPQFTQEQIEAAIEKANRYDLIAGDPVLAGKVADHFRSRTAAPVTPPSPNQPELNNEAIQEALSNNPMLKEILNRLTTQEVTAFKQAHPDMEELQDDMIALMKEYQLPMDAAYRFSKLAKQQAEAGQPPAEPPATPTTEVGKTAGLPTDGSGGVEALQKAIDDPKATPRLDDAIALAFKAAQLQAANQQEEE